MLNSPPFVMSILSDLVLISIHVLICRSYLLLICRSHQLFSPAFLIYLIRLLFHLLLSLTFSSTVLISSSIVIIHFSHLTLSYTLLVCHSQQLLTCVYRLISYLPYLSTVLICSRLPFYLLNSSTVLSSRSRPPHSSPVLTCCSLHPFTSTVHIYHSHLPFTSTTTRTCRSQLFSFVFLFCCSHVPFSSAGLVTCPYLTFA